MKHISHYHANDLMSLLICDNPQMLPLLPLFNISLGFADKTISEVCEVNNVDVNTFLAIVNVILCGDKSDHIDYANISIETLISYLKKSHAYHVDYRLQNIRKELQRVLPSVVDEKIELLVLRYFDEFNDEVREHLRYEEDVVFEYIHQLQTSQYQGDYTIVKFAEKHDEVDEKLSELKDVVVKYIPANSTGDFMSVLLDIFRCSQELQFHNNIENYLLVPLVKSLENK